jgi:hypothetical protein
MTFESYTRNHRRSWHGPPAFSNFLFTNLFSITFLYFIMSFKLGHVSIPKRRIFLPLFLLCAYDSSVLQNFKIFTHLLPNFSYKDPRMTEVTYHCINFNDRVRKVPKNYLLEKFPKKCYLNFWNFSDPKIYLFLIRKIWQ